MKNILFVLITSYMLTACGPIETHDKNQKITPNMSRGLKINGMNYTNYTLWGCRDYVSDKGIVLELVKTDVIFGDTMEDSVININETLREDKELKEDENVKDIMQAMNKLHGTLQKLKQGFILFDNRKEYADAVYTRDGINQRWDWEKFMFSFVIEPDGTGLYYDFRNVKDGESTKARDVFKCERIFSNID